MTQLALPTKEQVELADCEIGAIIHFGLSVYELEDEWCRQWDYNPNPEIFNPKQLNTDQWVKAVNLNQLLTGFLSW